MSKPEAKRQLERAKFLRELAAMERNTARRLDRRATEIEIAALEVLSEKWRKEHAKA